LGVKRPALWIVFGLLAATAMLFVWPTQRATQIPTREPGGPIESSNPAAAGSVAVPTPASGADTRTPRATYAGAQTTTLTPEQALAEVQALVNRGRIGAARALAEHDLRVIPDGPEARQIMSLTGVHPHP
jgi:hypothetical protein